MNTLIKLQSAYRCETGAVRVRNEDSCQVLISESGGHFARQPFGLFIVADGMGGHNEGHVASHEATQAFSRHILEHLYLPASNGRSVPDEADILEIMEDAMLAAHEAVYRPSPDENGGTTLTAVLLLGRRLYLAHVGDSRAYLLNDGELIALTHDHSLVRKLQERGQLTAAEAKEYQYRNVLLQALGQDGALDIETTTLALPSSGRVMLCSDGLSGFVSDDLILSTLEADQMLPQQANNLYEAAMNAGGLDNITVVLAGFAY